MIHSAEALTTIFDELFIEQYHTRLTGGAEEPLYIPAQNSKESSQIFFTRDYFASALHEIAHWCIAQSGRRQKVDYGYWYQQGPRSVEQQGRFQQAEQIPQALEWIFSVACNFPFELSFDNLEQHSVACEEFSLAVKTRACQFLHKGLPLRASLFAKSLAGYFGGGRYLDSQNYCCLPNLGDKENQ